MQYYIFTIVILFGVSVNKGTWAGKEKKAWDLYYAQLN